MRARRNTIGSRRGAAMVEAAIVLPVLFLFIFGIIVGGVLILNYQQIAMLAREGARYASVHGGLYAQENNLPAATKETVHTRAILPRAGGLNTDPTILESHVSWRDSVTNPNKMPIYLASPNPDVWRRNEVTVTVTYEWKTPMTMIFPNLRLSSTSVMPITY